MKKGIILLLVFTIMTTACITAQTWTGTTNTDWNTSGNWSPAAVPTSTSNVTIPGSVASSNWPVFAANVTLNTITMQLGSQLDVNGFTLSLNGTAGTITFSGATLNNSNSATDIVMNINTTGAGYNTYFRSNVINDSVTFNISGPYQFVEGDVGTSNQYNGNVSVNISSPTTLYISYQVPSQFNGNLSVTRTALGGNAYLFNAGANISGNYSFTNIWGGTIVMGNAAIKTSIGGTVNITTTMSGGGYPSVAPFEMYRLINLTGGGSINIQNSGGFNVQKDTLLVNSFSITGYKGPYYARLFNNSITGNVTIADDASYAFGYNTAIRSNVITGNSIFSNNGINNFYEADVAGSANTYFGNVTFNAAGGPLLIGFGSPLQCTGNLTINRTAAELTSAFNFGAVIGGNFTYTNNTAGETGFGNLAGKTSIGGTINITANFTTPNNFGMHRLVNQTNGGTITVSNSLGFSVQNDTLLVTTLHITGYKGNQYAYLYNNAITGNVTIADHASYGTGYLTYIRNNVITGNSIFTINGINTFAEADGVAYGNSYNGNVTFNCAGNGNVVIAYLDTMYCTGNLTINRTAAGQTSAFNSGAVIGGNFTYTNNTAGESGFGNLASKTSIGGTINITANFTTPNNFGMHRLVNQTNGGSITVTNSLGFSVQNDTLLLTSMNITGYKGGQYAYLYNNAITGNVTIADDASFGGGYSTNIRNNTINGNTSFTINGINTFAEADGAGWANRYNGNVIFNEASNASVYIAYLDMLYCTGNVTISRTAAGQTSAFNAGASIIGNFIFTNNTAGETGFGNLASKTSIGGTINITAAFTTPNNFGMHRLVNQTNGGSITVINSLGFSVQNDTLLLTSMNITSYKGGQYAYLFNNAITGNVTITNDVSYSGGYYTYLRNNIISGNTSISNNGSNVLFDADQGGSGNKYLGNITYIKNGADIIVGAGAVNELGGNLTLNSAGGIALGKIKFNGSTNGVVEQLGTQPINIAELTMDKTGTGKITLNDPVTITGWATFTNGNIFSSDGNELIFADNINYTGGSNTCYVFGPVTKIGNDAFTFPVGKGNKIAPISISAPSNPSDAFKAQYFNQSPHNAGYDSSLKDPSLHHISKNEYWLLNRTAGTSNVVVTLSWDSSSRSGIVNYMPDLRVARWNGSMWNNEGNGGMTGTNAAGTIQTVAAMSNFSPFTLASSSVSNPLPVHFILFNVSLRNNNTVLLNWTTSDEINNARFEVERSNNGKNWVKLSEVQPNSLHEYNYIDNTVTDGIYFYRIKQVDFDGNYKYSMVNMIRMNSDNKILIWPNPVTDHLYVQTPVAKGSVEIADMGGRVVRKEIIINMVTAIPVQHLARGLYMIIIRYDGNVFTEKLSKQ